MTCHFTLLNQQGFARVKLGTTQCHHRTTACDQTESLAGSALRSPKRHQSVIWNCRYLTATEWRTEGGGFKDKSHLPFKRLPFHCCAITFTPFEDPVSGLLSSTLEFSLHSNLATKLYMVPLAMLDIHAQAGIMRLCRKCWLLTPKFLLCHTMKACASVTPVACLLQACTADGTVYDITNIVPYVQKFKKHPVSGEPLQLKDIIQLCFHKNADNEYHDPILHKVCFMCSWCRSGPICCMQCSCMLTATT